MKAKDKKRLRDLLASSWDLKDEEINCIMNKVNSISEEPEECKGDDTYTMNIVSAHDNDRNLLVELAEEPCTGSVKILDIVEL